MSRRPVPAPRGTGANQQGLMSPPHDQCQPPHYRGNDPPYANLQQVQQPINSPPPPLPPREHTYDVPDLSNSTAMGAAMVAPNSTYSTTASNVIPTSPNSAYTMTSSPAEQQLQQEIHFLRMAVNDKDAQFGTVKRDLEFSHGHIKQLNVLLAEKKEEILKYQERISDMQSDIASLREQTGRMQGMPAPSQAEETLQMQVTQLNRQLADHRQQVNELSRQNHQLRQKPRSQSVPLRANSEDYETRALRQQVEQLRAEKTTSKQEMDMLRHQVTTYQEDFLSERKDRERAVEKIQGLREENDSLKQAIALLAREHNIRLGAYGLGDGANGQNQF